MASKWHGKQCPLCNEGTLRDGKVGRQFEYRGQVFESTVKGAFCDHCADGFPENDERDEAVWLAFRDRVDAEEVAELARIRKKLGLTQQEAAKLAGGGKNAFSRYERGQAKPVAAVTNLFRLLDRHPGLLMELGAGRSNVVLTSNGAVARTGKKVSRATTAKPHVTRASSKRAAKVAAGA